jgi:hypothetical protein
MLRSRATGKRTIRGIMTKKTHVSHRTDTHLQVFSLTLAFSIHDKLPFKQTSSDPSHPVYARYVDSSSLGNNKHVNPVSRHAPRQTLTTSVKLTYLSVYDSTDDVSEHRASPSPPSSLTHVHRCIGSRNGTRQTLPTSVKLTYLSVYDSRDGVSECVVSRSPPFSLTHGHRYIGSRNETRQTLPTSAKLTHLSMYDSRNDATQCM